MSTYRELPPGEALSPWVECFWTKRVGPGSAEPRHTRVVPDGSVDIILDARSGEGGVVGTMRRPKLIPHGAPLELVAVRFRPGGAAPFLGFPVHEITDRQVALAAAGLRGLDGSTAVAERVAEAPTPEAAIAVLRRALTCRLAELRPPDPAISAAVDRITATRGSLRIGDLAERLGLGTRRLGRLFDRHVGVSPKQLCRIVRLQRALRRLEPARRSPEPRAEPDWIALALDCGFFDQSHLVREFRSLTGTTPTGWLRG